MNGKYQIQLGADQFISGMSSSDFATDGALGTSSAGLNPFVTPGVIRALATSTDLSSNVIGNIIASSEDSQSISAYNRTFIDASGNYYTYNGSSVTKTNTATTNAAFYITAKTDMVSFAGNTYVTTGNGDIDRWLTSGPTLTNSWWVGTKSQASMNSLVPHPMVAYQGNLYIADANKLNTIASDSSTIALGVLTLNSNEIIYALGIDPGTGLMMISVQTTVNISDTLTSKFFVYLYDGISAKATRKIIVDDLVTAFFNMEGTVYVGMGLTIGEWNGSGVTFLRKLQNTTANFADMPYKHHFTGVRNILHVIDGQSVLSYGASVPGKKGFYYTATNPSGSGHLSAIFGLGSGVIAIAYATNKLASFDFTSTAAGSATLYFNNIYFPRPIMVRRMRMMTTGITTTSGIGSFGIEDERNVLFQPAVSSFVVLSTATPMYVFDADFSNVKLQAVQPKIGIDTQGFGIVRVYVYYDVVE